MAHNMLKPNQRNPYYNCPRCEKKYDICYRHGAITGRLPLILPCKHTVCNLCIREDMAHHTITCSTCFEEIPVEHNSKMKESQFPINFYLLGAMFSKNPAGFVDRQSLVNLQPAGANINQFSRLTLKSNSENNFDDSSSSISSIFAGYAENDSCKSCSRMAELKCCDCDEMYCKSCSEKLHSAKGLSNHLVSSLDLGIDTSFTKCQSHPESCLEYRCNTCNLLLCSHCVISEHMGHAVTNTTSIQENNVDQLMTLMTEAEQILARMQITQKEARSKLKLIEQRKPSFGKSENMICNYFADLHAHLQLLECTLLIGLEKRKTKHKESLDQIIENLDQSMKFLNRVIKAGKSALDPSFSGKLNVIRIMEYLENVKNSPCFLSHDPETSTDTKISFISPDKFNFEALVKLPEENSNQEYSLLKLSEMPKGTEILPKGYIIRSVSEDSLSVTTSIPSSRSCDMFQRNVALSSMYPKTSSPKVSSTTTYIIQRPCISLKKGKKLMITVKHINNPYSFYVQPKETFKYFEYFSNKLETQIQYASKPAMPELGKIYAVRYISDNIKQWCRGRVMDVVCDKKRKEPKYKIFYIDYGNSQIVERNRIRELTEELIQEEPFIIHCKLHECYPVKDKWNKESVTDMARIITDDQNLIFETNTELWLCQKSDGFILIMENDDGIYSVDLTVQAKDDNGINVGQSLKFLGHVRSEIDYSSGQTLTRMMDAGSNLTLFKTTYRFELNKIVNVKITAIDSPNKLYVQLKENQSQISKLKEQLTHYYYSENLPGWFSIYNPIIGMVVAVNCEILNGWIRGIITEIQGKGRITVFLVDYGGYICISHTKVKKLHHRFTSLEIQGIEVKLSRILPRNDIVWSDNTTEFLIQSYLNNEVYMIVENLLTTPKEVLLFEIQKFNTCCINALLVNQNFAVFEEENGTEIPLIQPKERGEELEIKLVKKQQKKTGKKLIKTWSSLTSNPGGEKVEECTSKNAAPVTILNIISPGEFYVIINAFKEKIQILEKAMLQFYIEPEHQIALGQFSANDPCIIQSKKLKAYCRAKIIQTLSEKEIKVFLLDRGIEEVISAEYVYAMHKEFFPSFIPYCAIQCHLEGINPAGDSKQWSMTACEKFEELTKSYSEILLYKCKRVNQDSISFPVKLWGNKYIAGTALEPSIEEFVLINSELVNYGVALPVPGTSLSSKFSEPESNYDDDDKKNKTIKEWLKALPIEEENITGVPTYVDDNGEIYFQNIVQRDLACNLDSFINNEIDTIVPYSIYHQNHEWKVGDLCTAKYHNDKKWYRGLVIAVNPGNKSFKVRMVDYGNVEDVKFDEIRPEIMQATLPILAASCFLNNVHPREGNVWLTSDIDIIHALIVDKTCEFQIVSRDVNNKPIVNINLNGKDINKEIIYMCNNLTNKSLLDSTNSASDCQSVIDNDEDVIIEDSVEDIKRYDKKYSVLDIEEDEIQIFIINVLDSDELVFEMNTEVEQEHLFQKLSKEIQNFAPLQPNLQTYIVGMPCLGLFDEDKKWYRAEILDFKNLTQGLVKIWFVDYGNAEEVNIKDIRMIKDEWLKLPLQQYRCKINIVKDKEKECQKILEANFKRDVYAKIITRKPKITLELYNDPEFNQPLFKSL